MSDIRSRGDGKRGIPSYIRQYTSPNENFEYGYLHSDALLYIRLKLECYKPHKASRHPTKCDVVNDVELFPTVYHRIYYCKFTTLSHQILRYKIKCIRIIVALIFLCVFFFFFFFGSIHVLFLLSSLLCKSSCWGSVLKFRHGT